jgi:Methyltransferase FkbM domain
VCVHNVALSQTDGRSTFYINNDESGVTDGLAQRSEQSRAIEVSVGRGDDFRSPRPPCVVKIDVEGFELEVLHGMSGVLADPALRAIFVEVHFLELANRGLPNAPADIVSLLRAAGFVVRWLDPSHVGATRKTSERQKR